MRYITIIICFVYSVISISQTIVNPVFDRNDSYNLHIDKIHVDSDSTLVFCTLYMEGSWANISPSTYIEDFETKKKYYIIRCEGLPFSPDVREFEDDTITECEVLLVFPSIIGSTKINLIENPEKEAFNIYGINLQKTFGYTYNYNDIQLYGELAVLRLDAMTRTDSIDSNDSTRVYIQKQLEASNYWHGTRSNSSAFATFNYELYYSDTENREETIKWGERAIDILRELPQDSIILDVLARAYTTLGTAYVMKKQIETGLQYYELSLAVRRTHEGIGVIGYVELLKETTLLYHYIENHPKALLYGKELADLYKMKYEENRDYQCVYINALNNLCEYQRMMSKREEALETGKCALALIEQSDGDCDDVLWLKYYIYNNLGLALLNNGQIEDAKTFFEKITQKSDILSTNYNDVVLNAKELLADIELDYKQDTVRAIHLYESLLLEENSLPTNIYLGTLIRLYNCYKRTNPDISLNYLNKGILFIKEHYGEESVLYARFLSNYVNLTWLNTLIDYKVGETSLDTLYDSLQKIAEVCKRHITNTRFNMSKTDRESYWNDMKNLFTWLIPTISGLVKTDEWNSMAYDASLFYKGVMLVSEVDFKNIIAESKDSVLVNLYSEYLQDLSLLEQQYSTNSTTINIDSLKSKTQQEELYLSQRVSWLNKQKRGTNITWKDVRDSLGDNDVAIEFVSFEGLLTNSIHSYYYAYVINKKSLSPQLIPLFREDQLTKYTISNKLDYKGISDLIWGNEEMYDAIINAHNIYFSASGLLNVIGIEYLPIESDHFNYINERFNIYRLSSTRELCFRNEPISINAIYLYGGLDYNSINNNMQSNDAEMTSSNNRLSRSVLESLVLRGDFEQLVGSLTEVKTVKQEMADRNVNCYVLTGQDGTEFSLKELSGTPINVLHLSTHGMYVPTENDSIRENNNFQFILNDEAKIDDEAKTLSRSFLVMSGGNALIHRDDISHEQDDGILTALEISHLFFPELDLVVLSACQTALGELDNDGVYGLQRGFKKAGANTILMSLDKVDDEATKVLMVEFYKNLMGGKTKLQSLKDAQNRLRQVDNGKYDDPKYWASFIMLDGLN